MQQASAIDGTVIAGGGLLLFMGGRNEFRGPAGRSDKKASGPWGAEAF